LQLLQTLMFQILVVFIFYATFHPLGLPFIPFLINSHSH
jgi:hypothetical protein